MQEHGLLLGSQDGAVAIMNPMRERERPYLVGLGIATAVSLVLLAVFSLVTGELGFSYMIWNLFLAWVPLALTLWLRYVLRSQPWSGWYALSVTFVWLVFVPNSFYILSDFIHVAELSSDQLLLGTVMIASFVMTGMWFGVISVYLVHQELLKRMTAQASAAIIGVILLISSVAIYVGRDLRWNSWDVLFNPFGILFDVSERLLHPAQYTEVLLAVLPFFALLCAMYFLAWQTCQSLRRST